MVRQPGRLDIGVDGEERERLSSNKTAVLLFHSLASAKDDGLSALKLAHRDLVELDLERCTRVEKHKKLTENKEQEDPQ